MCMAAEQDKVVWDMLIVLVLADIKPMLQPVHDQTGAPWQICAQNLLQL